MPKRVRVELGDRSYRILIGGGLLSRAGALCRDAGLGGAALVVTDRNVARRYAGPVRAALEGAGCRVSMAVVPAGESSKCGARLFELYDRALDAGLDRKSFVVALGGGVVGDLAGYLAASYLRGIAFVQIPTSLLAMVDSSVGGKTGIDLPRGKNLVGAFHQPALVLADTDTLSTLPRREYAAGLAEVVKYGVIRDAALFRLLERRAADVLACDRALMDRVIARCCEIKAEVVGADEREGGVRAILNFGHTLGHALENAAGYEGLLHGEAVAAGMGYAGWLSMRLCGLPEGDLARLAALLRAFGLPDSARGLRATWLGLVRAMALDKKASGRIPRFVLADRIGHARHGVEATPALMKEAWDVCRQ
ncbi:MAG: 3-dehydroquinate synthase [Lentisphaerae bacterium]|nr:3-dehydroquinate synthase [Lentisphaerota bacterium]